MDEPHFVFVGKQDVDVPVPIGQYRCRCYWCKDAYLVREDRWSLPKDWSTRDGLVICPICRIGHQYG